MGHRRHELDSRARGLALSRSTTRCAGSATASAAATAGFSNVGIEGILLLELVEKEVCQHPQISGWWVPYRDHAGRSVQVQYRPGASYRPECRSADGVAEPSLGAEVLARRISATVTRILPGHRRFAASPAQECVTPAFCDLPPPVGQPNLAVTGIWCPRLTGSLTCPSLIRLPGSVCAGNQDSPIGPCAVQDVIVDATG